MGLVDFEYLYVYFLSAVLALNLISPFVIAHLAKRKPDLFSPISVFFGLIFFCYLLPLPLMLKNLDSFSVYWPIDYNDYMGSIGKSLVLINFVVVFFHVGYAVPGISIFKSGELIRRVAVTPFNFKRFFFSSSLMTFAAIFSLILGIHLVGGLSHLMSNLGDRIRLFAGLNYFFVITNVVISVCVVWYYFICRGSVKIGVVFRLFFFFALLVVSFQGAKSTIFVFVLLMLNLRHFLVKEFRVSQMFILMFGLFACLYFYQIVVREILVVGRVVSTDTGFLQILSAMYREFSGNFMQLQTLSILIDKMPDDMGYFYGKTFLALITLPIPSSIYPDKLITSPGYFTEAFWPERWHNEGTTLPPGIIGEFYMNFGSIGVCVFAVVFGYLMGCLYKIRSPFKLEERVILLCAVNAIMLHYIRGEFVSPTLLLISVVIPAFLLLKLSRKKLNGKRALCVE